MSQNSYFQVLPDTVQQALGKAAFDAFVNFPPPFEFTKHWDTLPDLMKMRYFAMVESIMNTLQDKQEFVTTKLMAYNERQRVWVDAVDKFENWNPDDEMYRNNYQRLAHLLSLQAQVVNALLLINQNDIEQGNFQVQGDESTQRVKIPNTQNE